MTNKIPLKEELLKRVYELTDKQPRKPRSDKGKTRGPNSKVRSDKGTHRLVYINAMPAMKTYLSVKNKLLNRELTDDDEPLRLDHNNIFIVINRKSKSKDFNHTIIHRGKAMNRTVKHIKGYTIDVEKLRFLALQDALFDDFTCYDAFRFKQELKAFCLPNNTSFFELFSKLYHIAPEDAPRWKYEEWRQAYDMVCDKVLEPDFIFDYNCRPGTEAFKQEYGDVIASAREQDLMELSKTKAYINKRARYRDSLIASLEHFHRDKLLQNPESVSWSMAKLNKEIASRIDFDDVEQQADNHMIEWSNNILDNKE